MICFPQKYSYVLFEIQRNGLTKFAVKLMETTGDNDRAECISESHREFMRAYIEREEERSKATLERFLAGRLSQQGKSSLRSGKAPVAGR